GLLGVFVHAAVTVVVVYLAMSALVTLDNAFQPALKSASLTLSQVNQLETEILSNPITAAMVSKSDLNALKAAAAKSNAAHLDSVAGIHQLQQIYSDFIQPQLHSSRTAPFILGVGHHDPDIFATLASLGLPGVCFPQRYGGYGLDYLSLGLVCEELEYVDTVYRTVLSVHVGLVGMGLYTWATEEQKQQWLVPMASGKKLACYGLTQPNAGSDVASMQSTARRHGDGYG